MRAPQFKFLPIIDFENILFLFFKTTNTYTKLAEVGHTNCNQLVALPYLFIVPCVKPYTNKLKAELDYMFFTYVMSICTSDVSQWYMWKI